jgi:retinol-binding protein 3
MSSPLPNIGRRRDVNPSPFPVVDVQPSMFLRRLGMLFLTVPVLLPAAQTAAIPDTAPGRVLRTWLDALNSGERTRIEAYLKTYDPTRPVEGLMNLRSQTGGFDLVEISSQEKTRIEFRLKEKNGPTMAIGRLEVKDSDPPEVLGFTIRAIPAGVTDADFRIDAAIAKLNENYVFPDVAKKMEEAVRARQKAGEYDQITNGDAFAERLTRDFREVSKDRHLGVQFNPAARLPATTAAPAATNAANAPDPNAARRQMERMNCGFEKAERLPPNIGYLKFNMFARPDLCGSTATAAMNLLGSVDALIIDLRENGGGDPRMVAFISSYLFDEKTHLNDLYHRREDRTEEFWTTVDVPGKKLGGSKPVYVLTARRTFSGAEEFSYNLKNLKRATIVGETTGGGAHPVSGHRLTDGFSIGVPFARAINPISKKNWEGTGVEPDVKVAAADALETARKLALAAVSAQKPTVGTR